MICNFTCNFTRASICNTSMIALAAVAVGEVKQVPAQKIAPFPSSHALALMGVIHARGPCQREQYGRDDRRPDASDMAAAGCATRTGIHLLHTL